MMAQTGSISGGCWCRDVIISRELLAQVPEPLRGRACICRSCAELEIVPPSSIEDAKSPPVTPGRGEQERQGMFIIRPAVAFDPTGL
jgi:hypothetical protein